MMTKHVQFVVFLFLSILTLCSSQTLLYHCNFDMGLTDTCVFNSPPGAPTLEAPYGIMSNTEPIQPLSDVQSISLPTTPNNESCILPHIYPSETWPTYFCRYASETNYTCQTPSGTGNCMIGRYGLVKMTRNGQFHETYITLNTVQNHVSPYQCLDFHYYITEPSVNAFIGVAWSVGAGPFPITEVRAKSENKWEHHRYTYTAQGQSAYNIWFTMSRDSGNASFVFALDEIKIFDGPCESPTTISPDETVSNEQITSTTTDRPASISPSSSSTTTTSTSAASLFNTTTSTLAISVETSTEENTILDISSIATVASTPSLSTSWTTSTTPYLIPTKKSDLPLILGLALGVGVPVVLLTVGALVYYCKIIKPKQKIVVRGSDIDEIPMI